MDLSNLYGVRPLSDFTIEQKRSCILMWVALNMKLRLKEYNQPNSPTGASTNLWGVGRGQNRESRNFMENRVKSNIIINTLGADDQDELKKIMEDLANGIIEQSIIVGDDLLKAARNAKTQTVRNKYYKATNNPEYLKVVFIICVSNYAKNLLEMGIDINHVFLELRLTAMDKYRKELSKIWIEYAESSKEEEAYAVAVKKTEEIFGDFEKETVVTTELLDKLADERLVYKLMGEDNINRLIDITVDGLRERVTNEVRLFSIAEF